MADPITELANRLRTSEALNVAYEEAAASVRENIRLIDVAMHGEALAAKQASACDLVGPAAALRKRAEMAETELVALRRDAGKMDAVVHVLGIEDSEDDPAEAIRELQQDASERDHFNRLAFVDVGTGTETWKERAEKAEAEVARLTETLQEIADAHLPDQPAAHGGNEYDWAVRHIQRLRGTARAATRADPAPPVQSSAQPAAAERADDNTD